MFITAKAVFCIWFFFQLIFFLTGVVMGFDWLIGAFSVITSIVSVPVIVVALVYGYRGHKLQRKHQKEWDEIKAAINPKDTNAIYDAYFEFLDELHSRHESVGGILCFPRM